MAEIDIINQKGKAVEKLSLDDKVFDGKISPALMHQAVVTYLANRRQGTSSAKTRGEVRGGGKKPWRQKGTGRSRHGSIRSPLWKGGGIVFGPQPRDFNKKFPKRMKAMALKSALNAQLQDNALMIIDELNIKEAKTKEMLKLAKGLKLDKQKVRFVSEQIGIDLKRAARNIGNLSLEKADDLNTYTALDCQKLVFTKQSLSKVEEKIKKWLK